MKVGAPVTDITAGILAAFGVASALFERERTGVGRRVDTSLLEAGITQTYWQSAMALASGTSPGALGTAHPLSAPYQTFPTADGWINVGASNETTWKGLTRALAVDDWRSDVRFATNADRMRNLGELIDALTSRFAERGSDEWLDLLAREGVPAGPIASIGEMLEHPQTIARGMVIDVEHSTLGTVRSLGTPVKVEGAAGSNTNPRDSGQSDTPGRGAPLLGEHTREVLSEVGYTEDEISALVLRGDAVAR